ncbi:hypothetical protein [Rhizobium phage RHph_X2_30]|nr:hypothetical protein [Rhizobium phage RHph_X2_30]
METALETVMTQDEINRLWLAGETHAAARAYVVEYFRSQELRVDVNRICQSDEDESAVDVHFDLACVNGYCFTVWFEPAVNRVYGEW